MFRVMTKNEKMFTEYYYWNRILYGKSRSKCIILYYTSTQNKYMFAFFYGKYYIYRSSQIH